MLQKTLDRKEAEPIVGFKWSGPAQKYVDELEKKIRRAREIAKASYECGAPIGETPRDPRFPWAWVNDLGPPYR